MSINHIIWDIETVANARARDYFAKKKYEAPANYKDPAKIQQAITEARHKDAQKAALHWWTGQVVCVSLRWMTPGKKPKRIMGPNEKELLCQLFDVLETEQNRPTLIGKNGDTFDKPYVVGRALALDLGVPGCLKPFRGIEDINEIFGLKTMCDQRGTLNDYAFGMGIELKAGHGGQVQDWFNMAELGDASMWDRIGTYCDGDVDIVYEMFRRYEKKYLPRNAVPKGGIPDADIPFAPKAALLAAQHEPIPEF